MEIEDRQMSIYDSTEIFKLIQKLEAHSCDVDPLSQEAKMTYKGNAVYFTYDMIYDLLLHTNKTHNLEPKHIYYELKKLIQEESLDNMPMYIAIFPEIAKWRMEIGK